MDLVSGTPMGAAPCQLQPNTTEASRRIQPTKSMKQSHPMRLFSDKLHDTAPYYNWVVNFCYLYIASQCGRCPEGADKVLQVSQVHWCR
jgi:hypothetical protein